MEEIGLPPLAPEQEEEIITQAEKAARDYILSKIPQRKINVLDILVEITGQDPVTISVETEIQLAQTMEDINTETLAQEATQKAMQVADKIMKEIACKSPKH